MKLVNRFALVSLLTLCAFLVVDASPVSASGNKSSSSQPKAVFASGLSDGGRLIIKRSPVLGEDISSTIKIDGQVAGTSTRFREFETYLAPGQHVIVVSPNRLVGDWRGTVDVEAGKSYTYLASYATDHIVLDRLDSR